MALAVGLGGQPAFAVTLDLQDRAQLFAGCAGRYSAQMEHEWLLGRSGKDAQAHRRLFIDLLEAVTPVAGEAGLAPAQILHLRIQSKHAHARLLQIGDFHVDRSHAARAKGAAQREIRVCDMLLLG